MTFFYFALDVSCFPSMNIACNFLKKSNYLAAAWGKNGMLLVLIIVVAWGKNGTLLVLRIVVALGKNATLLVVRSSCSVG